MELNPIDMNSDLSSLRKIDWDLVIDRVPYQVYSSNFYHSIGSKFGLNGFYACPIDKVPSYRNLIQVYDPAPTWGIICNPIINIKDKWEIESTRLHYECYILRNGVKFYKIPGNDLDFCLSYARYALFKFQEHPVDFHSRFWKDNIRDMKIYYRGIPAIIKHASEGNFIIRSEIGKFPITPELQDEWYGDLDDTLSVDFLSDLIGWFRND